MTTMINPTLRFGFPVNPNNLFRPFAEQDYTAESAEKFMETVEDYPSLDFLAEIHTRDPREATCLGGGLERFLGFDAFAKAHGVQLMQHMSFMYNRSTDPMDFNFQWLVVPSEFQRNGSWKPVIDFPGKHGQITVYAEETPWDVVRANLELAARLQTRYLTVHITKSGTYLSPAEWSEFCSRIADMKAYADSVGYQGRIAVETGGGLRHDNYESVGDELVALAEAHGVMINMDTAHYMNDLLAHGATVAEANDKVTRYFDARRALIGPVHLTETTPGNDLHLSIDQPGAVTANAYIVRQVAHFPQSYGHMMLMSESVVSESALVKVSEMITDSPSRPRDGAGILIAAMGLPESGKSTTSDAVKTLFKGCIRASTKEIRDLHNQAVTMDEPMSYDQTEPAYEVMHVMAENALARGATVIVDGTYHLKHRQEQLADMARKCGVKDTYIILPECSYDTAMARIAANRAAWERNGKMRPPHLSDKIIDPAIYHGIVEQAHPIDLSVFPGAHVVRYNSTTNELHVENDDMTTRMVADKIADSIFNEMGITVHRAKQI